MIQNEMQSSTAQQHGFAGNLEEEKNLNDAVANFAQASASDRSAFTQLTDTNVYPQQHKHTYPPTMTSCNNNFCR